MPNSERVIGTYGDPVSGPQLLCIAGIHGNEPEGVLALKRVFLKLWDEDIMIKGNLVGVIGNRNALAEKRRYIQKDLNRQFSQEAIDSLLNNTQVSLQNSEDKEIRELIPILDGFLSNGKATTFLDLHATSGPGGAFSVCSSDQKNIELARALQFPVVYGLEKKLKGTLIGYLYSQGVPGIGFEGGQIGQEQTVNMHEAAIWTSMAEKGMIEHSKVETYLNRLKDGAEGLPRMVSITFRLGLEPKNDFEMIKGFSNFHRVVKGQELAILDGKTFLSPRDGLLLMPLYQPEGEDAFFIVEET